MACLKAINSTFFLFVVISVEILISLTSDRTSHLCVFATTRVTLADWT